MDDSKSINVLIVTDHFTTYAKAYVTPKQTAVMVARPYGKFPSKLWMVWENPYRSRKSFENNLIQE